MESAITTLHWKESDKPIIGVPLKIKNINLKPLLDKDHADPRSRELKSEEDRIMEAVQRLIFPLFPGTVEIMLNIECQIVQKAPEEPQQSST